ncbi:MAG: ribonuclease P protein component [Gammaproteobacteria bacterium]|nr:ribonuclease P protein component [Gammaproteobacteria bacterium]
MAPEKEFCSFPPSSRLLSPAQYRALFKGGKRISRQGLTLIVKPNGLEKSRLGMTTPKRLVKKAVGRNAIKRRIRESFRHNQQKLDGVDVVVMANSGISKLSYQQVFDLINPLWDKVAKLKWEDS